MTGAPEGQGTAVTIDGATLIAGRDVILGADERTDVAQDTVTATDILFAVTNANTASTVTTVHNDRALLFAASLVHVLVTNDALIDAGRDVRLESKVENDHTGTATTGTLSTANVVDAIVEGSSSTPSATWSSGPTRTRSRRRGRSCPASTGCRSSRARTR